MPQIAVRLGCSAATICHALHGFGIPVRARGAAPQPSAAAALYEDPEWLQQRYIDEGLGTPQIAALAGCSATTICAWSHRHGIPVRTRAEAIKAAWARGDFDNVFQSPTTIEIAVAGALDVLGYAYTPEYRPLDYSRPYDFYVFPDVLIEVQGDYWHNLPGKAEGDAEKAEWARGQGFVLVELWETDIREAMAADTMVDFVKSRIEAGLGG